jgi:hypothetical protein
MTRVSNSRMRPRADLVEEVVLALGRSVRRPKIESWPAVCFAQVVNDMAEGAQLSGMGLSEPGRIVHCGTKDVGDLGGDVDRGADLGAQRSDGGDCDLFHQRFLVGEVVRHQRGVADHPAKLLADWSQYARRHDGNPPPGADLSHRSRDDLEPVDDSRRNRPVVGAGRVHDHSRHTRAARRRRTRLHDDGHRTGDDRLHDISEKCPWPP